ncbi:autotransporter domain-containing protein [Microvirga makkahensis]|uniref:Autotransporter domain-containing protein n=1 Tax=Microvirga makkahensis TaxID=1128670 RepID=A0A7X3MUR7_9HYPH|nr:autotransporter domain-containing protein [Microvirga makkahensis]
MTMAYPTFDPRTFAVWGEGFGSWGRVQGDGNAGSLNRSTGGFVFGAEVLIEQNLRIGIAGGLTITDTDVGCRLSFGSDESRFGAIYGSGRWGAIHARLGVSYAWHDIDPSHHVVAPGLNDHTTASYDGPTMQAFG